MPCNAPQSGHYWYMLGVARTAGDNRRMAIAALQKSMEILARGDSRHQRLLPGHGPLAAWPQGRGPRVVRPGRAWMDKTQPKNEELRRFRAEAEELMEMKGAEKKTDRPP